MSSVSLALRQISRAKNEAETSLASARSLRDQWSAAIGQNPTGLTQKDVDHLSKAFKNRLLTVKWDCEDLEELVNNLSISSNNNNSNSNRNNGTSDGNNTDNCNVSASDELISETKCFIEQCRQEMDRFLKQFEDYEYNRKVYNKHGIAAVATTTPATPATPTSPTTTTDGPWPDNVVAQAGRPTFA